MICISQLSQVFAQHTGIGVVEGCRQVPCRLRMCAAICRECECWLR